MKYRLSAIALAALIWGISFFGGGVLVKSVSAPVEFINVASGLYISNQTAGSVSVELRAKQLFDDHFVTALATELAARINPQILRRNGKPEIRLFTVKEAATYVGRTEQALQHLIHKREIVVVRRDGECISTVPIWIAGSKRTRSDLRQAAKISVMVPSYWKALCGGEIGVSWLPMVLQDF